MFLILNMWFSSCRPEMIYWAPTPTYPPGSQNRSNPAVPSHPACLHRYQGTWSKERALRHSGRTITEIKGYSMIPFPNRWQFYKQDRPWMWQWRKFENNKVVAVSHDVFHSRPACVNDAKTRGYIDVDPKDVFCTPNVWDGCGGRLFLWQLLPTIAVLCQPSLGVSIS